jgi:4-oxalocrotonate tautomerase
MFRAIGYSTSGSAGGDGRKYIRHQRAGSHKMQGEFLGETMPYVQVTWVAGRTAEQKRKLAERITQALVEDGRAKRENIQVTFVDLPPTDYAEAGVTVADQKRTP